MKRDHTLGAKLGAKLGAQASCLQTRETIGGGAAAGGMPALPALLALLVFTLLFAQASLVNAQQNPLPREAALGLQNTQSLVARQAALVSEFEVNGLKVLLKRREGSLT